MTRPKRDSIADQLHSAGLRLTEERKLLLEIIDRNAHSDASEIYRLARVRNPKISLATVYRTLRLLKEMGVVHASALGEDHTHYEVRSETHIHLVCAACGKVLDLPAPDSLSELARQHGFQVDWARLEMYGLCPDCRRKKEAKRRS